MFGSEDRLLQTLLKAFGNRLVLAHRPALLRGLFAKQVALARFAAQETTRSRNLKALCDRFLGLLHDGKQRSKTIQRTPVKGISRKIRNPAPKFRIARAPSSVLQTIRGFSTSSEPGPSDWPGLCFPALRQRGVCRRPPEESARPTVTDRAGRCLPRGGGNGRTDTADP